MGQGQFDIIEKCLKAAVGKSNKEITSIWDEAHEYIGNHTTKPL